MSCYSLFICTVLSFIPSTSPNTVMQFAIFQKYLQSIFIWFHNHLITCMHMYQITIIWKQCIDISLWENAITTNLPTVFWEIFKTKNKMQYLAALLQPAGNLCTTQQKVNIGYIYNEILIMFPRNVFLFVFHQEGRI